MESNHFVDNTLSDLQDANDSPIFGYEDVPILILEEAIEKIISFVPSALEYVAEAKENCNRSSTMLTWDESAAIYLYSMQTPFFSNLNNKLRANDRNALKPWFAYLKLFIGAVEKLPSTGGIVWRGIKCDDEHIDMQTFADNDVQTWWSINSCSVAVDVVKPFLGEKGILFSIEAINAKEISQFSRFPEEREAILMPGTRLRIMAKPLNLMDRFLIVHLKEETSLSRLFELVKHAYQRNNRIERLMNPATSFPIEQSYINLAIVKAKDQQEKEKQLRDTQHANRIISSFEEIYGTKTPIDVKNIFETCKTQEKQVLVFGRAGIGKSTFCRYAAYKWATGSYWPQYKLLALIPLRRLTADRYPPLPPGQNYSLIDLVKKEVFQYELTKKDEVLLENQFDPKKTLWVLDGYDEIIQNVPSHLQSLFEQLLKTPHHIITSRPYMNTLSYDAQMEITGFTDENIEKYIQQFFNQLDDVLNESQKLFSFLKSNVTIWGVAHIPVNLELICTLWSNTDWSATEQLTITRLYTMMTECLCRRYLERQANQILQLSNEEVDQHCHKELTFLESLAFNAVESNTIILQPALLKKALNETKIPSQDYTDILKIGILKSFEKQGIGTKIEMQKDHYFVHLSFQEYFAARYLVNTLNGSSTENAIAFIKHQKYNQRYSLVFAFASGLLSDSNSKPSLNIFWDTILGKPLDLVGIRHMQLAISCLEETSSKPTLPRRTLLLEWIAECIQHSFSTESEIIRQHLSRSLRRAQSVVCDPKILNVLVNLLQYNHTDTIKQVLDFAAELQIFNPSIELLTSVATRLDDESKDVRENACLALGNMGEKAATNEVISQLVSALGDYDVGWNATDALVKMSGKVATNEVIRKLVSALGDESVRLRENACRALREMGEKAATNEVISQLVSALGDESEWVRKYACEALGNMGEKAATEEVISQFVNVLEDNSNDVIEHAYEALGKMGAKAATNEVISKIMSVLTRRCKNSSNFIFLSHVCDALQKMGENAVTNELISQLVNALGDEDGDVRGNACYALGKMGEKAATNEVISQLVSALRDESDDVRWFALLALGSMGEKAVTNDLISELVSALKNESEQDRMNACCALTEMGEKAATDEVISQLVSALEDENADVRSMACCALGKMGEKASTNEVISQLASVLKDEDEHVRQTACYALTDMGEKAATNEAISQLVSALGDESEIVRENACLALGRMGEKAATNEVISQLVNALRDESDDVREKACFALGNMGEKAMTNEVISQLVNALEDGSVDVGEWASDTLGKMREKAATNEVISKLVFLINDSDWLKGYCAANAVKNILNSPVAVKQLAPNVLKDVCLCQQASDCLENVLEDQVINVFLTNRSADYLLAVARFALLKGTAVVVIESKMIVYGSKEPVELSVSSLELRQQLIEVFTSQAKRVHLFFEVPSETENNVLSKLKTIPSETQNKANVPSRCCNIL